MTNELFNFFFPRNKQENASLINKSLSEKWFAFDVILSGSERGKKVQWSSLGGRKKKIVLWKIEKFVNVQEWIATCVTVTKFKLPPIIHKKMTIQHAALIIFHLLSHTKIYSNFNFIVLRKAFESFDSQKTGSISTETVAEILRLMGQAFNKQILDEMIEEVDEDKSGRLEFEEFIILCAKFIVEEDAEARE